MQVFLRFLITKLLSAFVCGWEGFEDRAKISIIYRLSRFKFAQIWDKARKLKGFENLKFFLRLFVIFVELFFVYASTYNVFKMIGE